MTFAYDLREGTHGNEQAFYAPINYDASTHTYTFGAIKPLTGATSVKVESKQDSQTFYADNQSHLTLKGNKKTTGEIVVYQIPQDFLVNHLGYKLDSHGALLDTGESKPFALGFTEIVTDASGKDTPQLHMYYNVTASAVTTTSKSDNDSVDLNEFSIPITVNASQFVKDKDGKAVSELTIRRTTANATQFDAAYTSVYIPATD